MSDNDVVDVDALERKARSIKAVLEYPWWTAKEAGLYMGRAEWYVRRLFTKGLVKRNDQQLTCRAWVDDYLTKESQRGRIKSPIK